MAVGDMKEIKIDKRTLGTLACDVLVVGGEAGSVAAAVAARRWDESRSSRALGFLRWWRGGRVVRNRLRNVSGDRPDAR